MKKNSLKITTTSTIAFGTLFLLKKFSEKDIRLERVISKIPGIYYKHTNKILIELTLTSGTFAAYFWIKNKDRSEVAKLIKK